MPSPFLPGQGALTYVPGPPLPSRLPQASYTSRLATLLRCEQSNTTEACLQLHATRRQCHVGTALLSLLRRKLWSNRKRVARIRRALLKRTPCTSKQQQVGKLLGTGCYSHEQHVICRINCTGAKLLRCVRRRIFATPVPPKFSSLSPEPPLQLCAGGYVCPCQPPNRQRPSDSCINT